MSSGPEKVDDSPNLFHSHYQSERKGSDCESPTSTIKKLADNQFELLSESASPSESEGYMSILRRPIEWLQSSTSSLIQSMGTVAKVSSLAAKTLAQGHGFSAASLAKDYLKFRNSQALQNQAQLKNNEPTEEQKRAMDLHQRRDKLSPSEKIELQDLLKKIHDEENQERRITYESASFLYQSLAKEEPSIFIAASRSDIEGIATKKVQEFLGKQTLSLKDYSLVQIVTSKILVKQIDKKQSSPQNISFLAAVANEHNRLQTKNQIFTGEDFLRVKIAELEFLFEGMEQLDWNLCFVEDNPQNSTIDIMKQMIEGDPQLAVYKHKVLLLDYSRDLREEIAMYKDPSIRDCSPEEFARKSIKGGAIQVGLRYLAQLDSNKAYKGSKADLVICTDCDLSFNLSHSGILLNQIYNQDADIAIGSRRLADSYVAGKSMLRHVQSSLFNTLVRVLLNVQVTDTQVGAKAIRPELVEKTHERYRELSMSFDSEILKLATEEHVTIKEDGIVWIDSPFESKTTDQAGNMFQGLLEIYQRMYPAQEKSTETVSLEGFKQAAHQLSQEEKFDVLLELAMDPKWNFLISNFQDLYETVSPKEFREFVTAFRSLLTHMALGNVNHNEIQDFINSIQSILANAQDSNLLSFLLHEFPQLMDVIELIHINPQYAGVIVPLLFGQNPVTQVVSKHGFDNLAHFASMKRITSPKEAFMAWIEMGTSTTPTSSITKEEPLIVNDKRISIGKQSLRLMNEELKLKGEKKRIGIIMTYNMDRTPKEYVDKVLRAKMTDIHEQFGEFEQIEWDFIIVDSRKDRQSEIGTYFDQVLKECSAPNIRGFQTQLDGEGKATSVQHGMDVAMDTYECDYVGFVDFSPKIHILEISNFVSDLYIQEKEGKQGLAIGSRWLEESDVANKSLPFLVRSLGLNILVKSLFPHLFSISDTQTGFKFFHSGAWSQIRDQQPKNRSLAFDVELLQLASRDQLPIHELPIDFNDTTIGIQDFQQELVANLFEELLSIRAQVSDSSSAPLQKGETKLIGGGAENVVYQLEDGSILKIPHEAVDPNFVGFLKHFLFKDQKEMGVSDQQDKLITSQVINRLLSSPRFSKLIPLLRDWKDLNIFVMKCITAFENKMYKSMGYETAQRLGKNLVIPFRFVQEPVALKIDGEVKIFSADDKVKQSLMAKSVYKQRLMTIIEDTSLSSISKKEKLTQLIDEGIRLFGDLWKRGLFDLDTNLMCDTGFYPDADDNERLMVLDPGELIDDLSVINLDVARNQIDKRYDFVEMGILLREHFPEGAEEMLDLYKEKMYGFLDHIEQDLEKPEAEREFNSDERFSPDEDFSVQFNFGSTLPNTSTKGLTPSQKTRAALKLSSANYQLPYRPEGKLPQLTDSSSSFPYLHVVPEEYSFNAPQPNETAINVSVGSVGPLEPLFSQLIQEESTNIVMLDAGTATRSSLLKYGTKTGTKGGVCIAGEPLYAHSAKSMQKLAERLGDGYVILSSSDDLIEFDEITLSSIEKYFKASSEPPGCYWCDLPEGGQDFVPHNVEQAITFFGEKASLSELALSTMKSIPPLKGAADVSTVDSALQLGKDLAERSIRQFSARKSGESSGNQLELPFLSSYITQFIQYNAQKKLGGMKTPFLLVFKKEMLEDFSKEVIPLLPKYIWTHITWENLLIRGFKADRVFWNNSGKPPFIGSAQWNQIYDKIQEIKNRHHIDTQCPDQNRKREFTAPWQNFDDPYALMSYIEGLFSDNPPHVKEIGNVKVIGDSPIQETGNIHSQSTCNLISVNSPLKGNLVIKDHKSASQMNKVMFVGVELKEDEYFEAINGHMVINIKGNYYSISCKPMSKDQLQEEVVYMYEDGIPKPFVKFKDFTKMA